MGACISFQGYVPTAKLMVQNAGLLEFMEPVKVEDILRDRRLFFVCDARSIVLDDYLQALRLHDRLELNQLYFLFPIEKMPHRLTALDIVTLAGYAGAAMKQSGYKRSRKVAPLEESNMNGHSFYELLYEELSHGKSSSESSGSESASVSVGKARTTMLSPIAESPSNQSFESN